MSLAGTLGCGGAGARFTDSFTGRHDLRTVAGALPGKVQHVMRMLQD